MREHLSRAEIGKDVVQDTFVAAVTTAGRVGQIVTVAVRDVTRAVGGFATDVFEISDAARRAAAEEAQQPDVR